jgi:hypothetical protein
MYETLEHWKQYKQEKEIKAIKLEAIASLDKFINKLAKKNGTTKY